MSDSADFSLHISPTSGEPVFRQICSQIERHIDAGLVPAGSGVPAVDVLARRLAINPVAVSRAYHTLLERGRFTRDDDGALSVAASDAPEVTKGPGAGFLGDEPYVFVSYAHADRDAVFSEIRFLRGIGVNVWYDDGITPGSSWDEEIAGALANCSLFLYFVTPASVASQHCRNEVNFCLSRNIRLLCVHLQKTTLPPGLELSLSTKQAIDVRAIGHDRYRTRLRDALGEFATAEPTTGGQASAHTSAPASAPANADAPAPGAAGSAGARRTLAVLPLANQGNDEDCEHLCRGIAEELTIALAAVSGVSVVPQVDAFALPAGAQDSVRTIGELLHCELVLTGSLQIAGDRMRARLNLARADDGASLWSARYDGRVDDPFAFQDEMTASVAADVSPHLT